jgi:hypothetical protein
MSAQIARTMMRDDGVTPETSGQIEALYLDTLDALEPIFRIRPFLLGARPCEADFGLLGSIGHFFSDPTPAAIMRERAPAVAHWVTGLWATRPDDIMDAAPINALPDDGLAWRVPASPYRAQCLVALLQRFAALTPADQSSLHRLLDLGAGILAAPPQAGVSPPHASSRTTVDRHWIPRIGR